MANKYIALSPLHTNINNEIVSLLDTFCINKDCVTNNNYLVHAILDDKAIIGPFFNKSIDIAEDLVNSAAYAIQQKTKIHIPTNSWKKLLFLWAWQFVQYVYITYFHIKNAIKILPSGIFITDKNYLFYIKDFTHFRGLQVNNIFTLHLYSDIIRYLDINRHEINIQQSFIDKNVFYEHKTNFKNYIVSHLQHFFLKISNKKLHILDECYGASTGEILHQNVFRLIQSGMYGCKYTFPNLDVQFRKGIFNLQHRDEFTKLIGYLAPKYIPVCNCEALNDILDFARHYKISNSGVLASSTTFYSNPILLAHSAITTSPLAIIEHGGDQLYRHSTSMICGMQIADRYYGYGNHTNFFLPSPFFADIHPRISLKRPLLVGTGPFDRYCLNFHSRMSVSAVEYITSRNIFLSNVHPNKLPEVRLWFLNSEIDEHHILNCAFPLLTYQDANSISLKQAMSDSCLLVLDHYSTPFHEALGADRPCIIFTKPDLYSEKGENILTLLRACGIWHDTPESAAAFYMQLVGKSPSWREAEKNILDWWQSAPVRKARTAFCEGYAQTDPRWARIWQNAFDELCG